MKILGNQETVKSTVRDCCLYDGETVMHAAEKIRLILEDEFKNTSFNWVRYVHRDGEPIVYFFIATENGEERRILAIKKETPDKMKLFVLDGEKRIVIERKGA